MVKLHLFLFLLSKQSNIKLLKMDLYNNSNLVNTSVGLVGGQEASTVADMIGELS